LLFFEFKTKFDSWTFAVIRTVKITATNLCSRFFHSTASTFCNFHWFSATKMDTICRTCLSTDQNMENIFEKREETEDISEILGAVVAGVEYRTDEELPKNICQKCLQALMAAYEFCQMCKYSDDSLREMKLVEPGT
jgi:Zinc-finger associated domain (zf-AD)